MGPEPAGWERPQRIGDPSAADQAHFVAAPLLAGASIATVGVLGADGAQFRWPGPAMLCFTLSAMSLIASIQLAVRGRRYLYTPGEALEWWGHESEHRIPRLQREHRRDLVEWMRWKNFSATAYNFGVVALGLGAMGLLAPPEAASPAHTVVRWVAVAAAAVGTAWETTVTVRETREFIRYARTNRSRRP